MSLLLGHTQQEWIIYLSMFTYFHTISPECVNRPQVLQVAGAANQPAPDRRTEAPSQTSFVQPSNTPTVEIFLS